MIDLTSLLYIPYNKRLTRLSKLAMHCFLLQFKAVLVSFLECGNDIIISKDDLRSFHQLKKKTLGESNQMLYIFSNNTQLQEFIDLGDIIIVQHFRENINQSIQHIPGNILWCQIMLRFITLCIPFIYICLLYTSPSPRDGLLSRMPSSA